MLDHVFHVLRAILKNNWNEVVELILKPRPGGKSGRGWGLNTCIPHMCLKPHSYLFTAVYSRERILGPLQRGVGKDSGPRGSSEKTAKQALCGGPAIARPLHVRQKEHSHCIRTGEFLIFFKLFKVV